MPLQISISNSIGGGGGSQGATPTPAWSNTLSTTFDGVDDYVDCGDNNNLSFGDGSTDSAFSISAWIKMTDATRFRVVSKLNGSIAEYAFFTSASDQLYFALYDNTTSKRISRHTSSTLTSYENQWIHLTATYNGSGGLKIYLNNTRIDNTTSNVGAYTAMNNTTAPFEIGKYSTSSANGLIDEVSIFNTELSQTNITDIYNLGTPNDISAMSGLVSYWRMGDGSTYPIINDEIGSNDGTMIFMIADNFVPDVPT